MNWTRLGAAVAVGVVAVWAALFALLSLFRIVLCAETEMHRTVSPDRRTVAIARADACLTKHATVLVLERAGLPRTTLIVQNVRRVQDVHAVWQADRELWVTLTAGDRDAAEAAGDAPRRFDDVTIRYFTQRGEELRARE